MPLSLTRTELLRSANLIDGTWRDAHDGSRFAVTDPARLDTVPMHPTAAPPTRAQRPMRRYAHCPPGARRPLATARRSCVHGTRQSSRIPTISRS